MTTLLNIFLTGVFLNNFVLVMFLGLCSFFGVSKETKSALGMSATVTFVLTATTPIAWIIYYYILDPLDVQFLGIYLPLVAANCAILGAALLSISWRYGFLESIVFGFSAGIGYSMVLLMMSGIRERMDLAEIPRDFKGAPIAFIVAGILSMAFMHYFRVFVI